jgi:hypothetical protein
MMAQLAAGASAYRPNEGGYGWRDKPKEPETEEEGAEGAEGAEPQAAEKAAAGDGDAAAESITDKARRVQDRGGSSVSLPTYTANPYYQTPGERHPAPETLPEPARAQVSHIEDDDDGLGDGEDDLA